MEISESNAVEYVNPRSKLFSRQWKRTNRWSIRLPAHGASAFMMYAVPWLLDGLGMSFKRFGEEVLGDKDRPKLFALTLGMSAILIRKSLYWGWKYLFSKWHIACSSSGIAYEYLSDLSNMPSNDRTFWAYYFCAYRLLTYATAHPHDLRNSDDIHGCVEAGPYEVLKRISEDPHEHLSQHALHYFFNHLLCFAVTAVIIMVHAEDMLDRDETELYAEMALYAVLPQLLYETIKVATALIWAWSQACTPHGNMSASSLNERLLSSKSDLAPSVLDEATILDDESDILDGNDVLFENPSDNSPIALQALHTKSRYQPPVATDQNTIDYSRHRIPESVYNQLNNARDKLALLTNHIDDDRSYNVAAQAVTMASQLRLVQRWDAAICNAKKQYQQCNSLARDGASKINGQESAVYHDLGRILKSRNVFRVSQQIKVYSASPYSQLSYTYQKLSSINRVDASLQSTLLKDLIDHTIELLDTVDPDTDSLEKLLPYNVKEAKTKDNQALSGKKREVQALYTEVKNLLLHPSAQFKTFVMRNKHLYQARAAQSRTLKQLFAPSVSLLASGSPLISRSDSPFSNPERMGAALPPAPVEQKLSKIPFKIV